MSFSRRLPWTSLCILLVAYTIFGYNLPLSPFAEVVKAFPFADEWLWGFAIAIALLLSAVLTIPFRRTKAWLVRWSKTDLGLFVCSTTLVFLSVLILSQLRMFASGLVLLAAGALVRLNLQTSGFIERHAFILMSSASVGGLALGWVVRYLDVAIHLVKKWL